MGRPSPYITHQFTSRLKSKFQDDNDDTEEVYSDVVSCHDNGYDGDGECHDNGFPVGKVLLQLTHR